MRQRDYHLIRQLRRSHDVHVVVLADAPSHDADREVEYVSAPEPAREETSFSVWSHRWSMIRQAVSPVPQIVARSADERLGRVFRRLAPRANAADRVWISRAYYARLAFDAGIRRRMIVDFPDIDTLAEWAAVADVRGRGYRCLAYWDVMKLFAFERAVARRAWRCVVCKDEDRRFFGSSRRSVHVVPNGTEIREPLGSGEEDSNRILFVGLMSYEPNADAARWFVRECLPEIARPDRSTPVVFDVVGADPPKSVCTLDDGKQVRVHGFVDDIRDSYRRAGVVIAPIRLGSGTRLKVLEALSYGKALVATSEAVRGLDLRLGVDLEVADSAADFAAACRLLLDDAAAREKLGRSGRERVNALYSWERIGEIVDRVVTS
jgi:glycosyltransferase involved in cell wall biosynthesis